MTTIRSRFKLRRRMLEAYQERNYSEEAGLHGEEIARKNLELKLGPQGWNFFSGVLIPDPNRIKGRFEIDIVAISPKGIVLIEVKHWKGKIEISEDGMKQVKGKVDYPFNRLDDRINQISRILRPSIIENKVGEDSPPIKAAIILTHKSSSISSSKRGKHSILKMKDSTAIKSLFDGEERMNSNMRKHIIDKLLEFGTWDTIQHKGKNENGLIRWGQIPEERKELLIDGIDILDRAQVKHFTIKQNCGWFTTLWKNPTLSIEIYLRNNKIIQSNIGEDSLFPWIQPG
ncbi:MAG: nuclease-related domain-containing protein, partial [Candidatus Thermoplasmatota archaeon]|nr:nuclease-related domain-containing protein [Candidatus Thermoplasmatota archaeon]